MIEINLDGKLISKRGNCILGIKKDMPCAFEAGLEKTSILAAFKFGLPGRV
jgi:hypothetical protein